MFSEYFVLFPIVFGMCRVFLTFVFCLSFVSLAPEASAWLILEHSWSHASRARFDLHLSLNDSASSISPHLLWRSLGSFSQSVHVKLSLKLYCLIFLCFDQQQPDLGEAQMQLCFRICVKCRYLIISFVYCVAEKM